MQIGPTTIAQGGVGGYRVSQSPAYTQRRPLGVTIDWSTVTPIGGKNAMGTITISATGGTFTLTYGGQVTGNIAWNATADAVETALEALSSIGNGNVRVSGNAGGPYTYEFVEGLRHAPITAVTGSGASLTGGAGTVTIAVTQAGAADVDEVLPGGLTAKLGEYVLRAGSVIYRLNSGLYGVAGSATNLVRGACYVVDRHYFRSIDLDQVGDVFDSGTAYRARLLLDGANQVTETNFLTAFPGVRLLRD